MNIGGAGEPTSHPLFFEFLKELRLRNITINIFSHFAYMTPARIEELHELGNEDPNGLRFIINISAATAETYGKIRPNQSPEVFEKVISLLKLVSRKRTEAGRGIFFTYMSVTNALNYHEIPLMVFKAFEVGAHELWIKPIEAHGEEILKYLINDKHLLDYLINLKLGLYFADHLEVAIKHRYEIELVLTKHEKLISAHLINKSFNMHIKETLIRFPELEFTFTNNIKKQTSNKKIEISIEKFEVDLNSTDNIQNGGISNKLYDKAPCNIGYEYIRFGVNQEVWPCCIAKHPLSQDGANGILSNWHNDKLTNFRHITANFPQSKLHRIDNDWNFCQQCPHTLINEENYRLSEMN
jgi:MoaA/NifB/PqqE/SkfB family radical SAM enzyme